MGDIELLYASDYGNSIYGSTYTYTFKKDYPLVICFNVSSGNGSASISAPIEVTLKSGTYEQLDGHKYPSGEQRGLEIVFGKITNAKSGDKISLKSYQLSYAGIVAIG